MQVPESETELEASIFSLEAGFEAVTLERNAARDELSRAEALVNGMKACPFSFSSCGQEPIEQANTAHTPAVAWEELEASAAKEAFYAENIIEVLKRYIANG